MKKLITACVAVLVCLCAAIAAAAYINTRPADKTEGSVGENIVGRVEMSVSPSEQTFSRGDGSSCVFRAVFSAKKNDPSFSAVINSVRLDGMEYESFSVDPEYGPYAADINNCMLPVDGDGNSVEMRWVVEIVFTPEAGAVYEPVFKVDYTSGVKPEAANRQIREFPLKIEVLS